MATTIERQLAEALSTEAGTVPPGVSEALTRIDYHPRTSRLSAGKVGAIAGGAGVVVAAVTATLVLSASPAFAGWTAQPHGATQAQRTDASAACAAGLAQLPGSNWTALVTDVRGPYTLVVYQSSSGADATCLTGSSMTEVDSVSASGSSIVSVADSGVRGQRVTRRRGVIHTDPSSGLVDFALSQYTASGQGSYAVADGQVAPDVSAVTIDLNTGQTVETTIGGGWLIAWWPGDARPVSALVTTPSGTTTVPLTAP